MTGLLSGEDFLYLTDSVPKNSAIMTGISIPMKILILCFAV